MRQVLALTKKELKSTFGSPLALIFIGAFLLSSLFIFFWVEAFFVRSIADLRPLFKWMPILLIFLVSALSMRQWSEEERSGTLEMLLTLPISPLKLVFSKFLAVMAMVAISLTLTLGLPITVSLIGNLDWGPVIGGYLAALLLAAAYTAIGLFISSRTSNQIVALILSVLVGGIFYLIGSSALQSLFRGNIDDLLRALGTGSRFESIERGVIDLRDLIYYLSLTGIFLGLNVLSLDSKRWSQGKRTASYRRNMTLGIGLLIINFLLLNVWLFPLRGLRADITQDQRYSLSSSTKDLLDTLSEPLLIRAYVSEQTHPLLAPLIPQVADMLREYEIAGKGKITANVVDPQKDPELEAEANQTYGIQPRPFQVADRYQSSVVNAYFDILLRYGDQAEVIPFGDLIEVLPSQSGSPDVQLRNLEYDLTRTIKKVVYGFQTAESLLASLDQPAKLTLFETPETVPAELADASSTIASLVADLNEKSGGKLEFRQIDPLTDTSYPATRLSDEYGIDAIPTSFFSNDGFYQHMLLELGDNHQVIFPSNDVSEASIRSSIDSAIQRLSPGFLRAVGLWLPPAPEPNQFGQQMPQLYQAQFLTEQLGKDYRVESVDLSTGKVDDAIDTLIVLAPQNLTEEERFAVDQFLMRGGSLIVATGNYGITVDQFGGGLALEPLTGGLNDLLSSYGVTVGDGVVMDTQNAPFPVAVNRNVGGFQVQEIQAIDYPYFVDVRPETMTKNNLVVSGLSSVTLNFASPLSLSDTVRDEAQVLLSSSPKAWLSQSTQIQPNFDLYPELGFAQDATSTQSYPLAVALTGKFSSYYTDHAAPFEQSFETDAAADDTTTPEPAVLGTIKSSPEDTRLIVLGSSEFINDTLLDLSARLGQDRSLSNLQLMQNAVDWSVEDADLLSIRARGSFTRLLKPLSESQETFWEVLNYVIALLALIVLAAMWQIRKRNSRPINLASETQLSGGEA
ncbi:MAG: Gldg family protein [Trueperaceae bacterium]|nr:Gldg family protein [Trueperaceae bacterium]